MALRKYFEKSIENILLFSAVAAVFIVMLIFIFIFMEGLPVIQKYGLLHFITGELWHPDELLFGLWPMIVGSIYVTLGALILGVPLGLGCAIFLAEIAPRKVTMIIRPMIELLAGIPSVVYGLYGLVVLVPLIRDNLGGMGLSVLAGSIILAMMILPTIISISEDSIVAIPREYKEGSLALGATHWQTIKKVILPTARSGIVTAVVLGMGRAIGETMAIILITGNVAVAPGSILEPVRTLTANIAIEMGYASGDHAKALFATGIILFTFIILVNSLMILIPKKVGD